MTKIPIYHGGFPYRFMRLASRSTQKQAENTVQKLHKEGYGSLCIVNGRFRTGMIDSATPINDSDYLKEWHVGTCG